MNPPVSPPMSLAASATPMMAQYLAIKENHPDTLVFYRMGDFYELFFDDAVNASGALDIALTRRGKHQGRDIPMCGVPVQAADSYLQRLIRKGFKVAVCEQTGTPDKTRTGSKTLMRREVVRVVTPGTLTEEVLLESRAHSYLAALARGSEKEGAGDLCALAWADVSTGIFCVRTVPMEEVAGELARLSVEELLADERTQADPVLGEILAGHTVTSRPGVFDPAAGERRLKELLGVQALEGFGDYTPAERAVCGAVVDYVGLTQAGEAVNLPAPRRIPGHPFMVMDATTRANLELVRTVAGETKGSVLSVIDQTVTGAGGRLLAGWLTAPLTDVDAINRRLDAVDSLTVLAECRGDVRQGLRGCPDMTRALRRVMVKRGGPRDLAALRDGLQTAHGLGARLAAVESGEQTLPEALRHIMQGIGGHGAALCDHLTRALADELPLRAADGGFIRQGYDASLDALQSGGVETRRLIASLQTQYATQTGVRSLKIRHHATIGYHVEVPSREADKLASGEFADTYTRRQTMTNATRFTTGELSDLDRDVRNAGEQALAREMEVFEGLVGEVADLSLEIMQVAESTACLDVFSGLAELAVRRNYRRPVVDESDGFAVTAGRHPVVEAALAGVGEGAFVANDCRLDAGAGDSSRLWLLTGPNMAGKSTFLRQNALLAIMAQTGSFVPAEAVSMGVVDRLFSRVGAADDLARGRSTFMVEMIETAAILNQAGEKSLVILDEIGRGTATFDGLSIAWAAVEHLHDVNRCRGLFATHFHELTVLSETLTGLHNAAMAVREWRGEVVFLHEVRPGAADRSYGIQVARLAGLPASVLKRARAVLTMLEAADGPAHQALPLFSQGAASPPPSQPPPPDPLRARLHALRPDNLTPREALQVLYELCDSCDDSSGGDEGGDEGGGEGA